MMKKTLKLASLTFLMFGCVVASEFRPPLSADRGPQRLDMNVERDADSNWDLEMYSVGYSRDANKSFTKHGMNTAPLSALIFGKDSFKVSDALKNKLATDASQKFNANLDSTILYPRVTYSEKGINLGGKIGYRVWNGKGSVGLKLNIPLKTVRMERDNNAETAEQGSGQSNYVFGATAPGVIVPVDHPVASAIAGGNEAVLYTNPTTVGADLYKVATIKNFPFNTGAGIQPFIRNEGNAVAVGGQAFSAAALGTPVNDALGLRETADIPFVFFYNANPATVPNIATRAIKLPASVRGSNAQGAGAAQDNPVVISTGVVLPAQGAVAAAAEYNNSAIQGSVIQSGGVATTALANISISGATGGRDSLAFTHFDNGAAVRAAAANQPFARVAKLDPAGPIALPAADTLYTFPAVVNANDYRNVEAFFETYKDNLWMMTVSAADGVGRINNGQNDALKGLINRYATESAEQWLWRNGYAFATNQRTGLGDITVNPCYDHSFSAAWQGGVYAHVLIPTGGSRKGGDPYKARLGNDNHIELGGGANVAWQALDWMNIRLDAMAAYALPGKERIAATFKDATVKAVGPAVDADIDYTRVKASVDTTLVHPQASSLAMTIGYDFEFKTKDNVSLKDKTYTFKPLANDANSWFGGFWDNAAPAGFKAKTVPLDGSVHAKDSERISHNIRVESSWHATEKLSLFWGGSAPIAGQYVAKMSSIYGGMNVKY